MEFPHLPELLAVLPLGNKDPARRILDDRCGNHLEAIFVESRLNPTNPRVGSLINLVALGPMMDSTMAGWAYRVLGGVWTIVSKLGYVVRLEVKFAIWLFKGCPMPNLCSSNALSSVRK
jgi:hypothetical protein